MAALRSFITRWRSESGAEFVEFALAFPLLLLVVLGIMDFGMMFQQYEVITNAAREGARVGVLPNYANPVLAAQQRAVAYAAQVTGPFTANVPLPTIQTGVPVGGGCIDTITVVVTYPHQYIFLSGIASYFGSTFGTKTLTATSVMRIENAGSCP
jgi:Flp pilus assembly protein TadG